MKKFLIFLLIVAVIAVGCFMFYKTREGREEPKNETVKPLTSESTNEVINKIITNEVNNKTAEKNEVEETIPSSNANPSKAPEVNEDPFVRDFDNYNPEKNEVIISEEKAKEIAQIGFEESKKRIAGEGADDIDSQKMVIEEISPNNYFTRKDREYDKTYTNIKRKAYIFTRTNDMGNGIRIYIDATTGLIIGGAAFGD